MTNEMKQLYQKRKAIDQHDSPQRYDDVDVVIQYARRKALVQQRRNERCSKCKNFRLFFNGACNSPRLVNIPSVKPYWHMACFTVKP